MFNIKGNQKDSVSHKAHKVFLGSRNSGFKERVNGKMTSKSMENEMQTLQKHVGNVIKLVKEQ